MDSVLYHGNCPDGWCAAFVAWNASPEWKPDLFPVVYDQEPPWQAIEGKDVFMVDFTYPPETMTLIAEKAKSLVVLDHHESMAPEVKKAPYMIYDSLRSGAQLAWDYFYPGQTRPWYVNYVGDRDLWKFQMASSKEVNAFLMSQPYTIEAWMRLKWLPLDVVEGMGQAVLSQVNQYVRIAAATAQYGELSGHRVAVVNAQYHNLADIGEAVLAEKKAGLFLGWFERGDGKIHFSLYSRSDGPDVGAIAKEFDGGGHLHAAGFRAGVFGGRAILDLVLGKTAL